MPGGDGTGPMGQGSMTGRGAGYCVGYNVPGCYNVPGYMNNMPAGLGRGRGRGFAFRRNVRPIRPMYHGFYYPTADYPLSKEQEADVLENEIKILEREHELLKDEMENLARRLNELKAQKEVNE